MARSNRYDVPTKVLLDQTRVTLDDLSAAGEAEWLGELNKQGLDTANFIRTLKKRYEEATAAEVEQEKLKAEYVHEARDDQRVAEQGFRWIQRVQSRGRHFLAAEEGDRIDVAGRLRFGKLHTSRARGVVYEMRIILPELDQMKSELKSYGLTDDLVAEGRTILERLGAKRAETAEVKARQKATTQKVRNAELDLTRLLDRLTAADEAAALERPENEPHFRFDLIHAERGRVDGMRRARIAKQPADSAPIDE